MLNKKVIAIIAAVGMTGAAAGGAAAYVFANAVGGETPAARARAASGTCWLTPASSCRNSAVTASVLVVEATSDADRSRRAASDGFAGP